MSKTETITNKSKFSAGTYHILMKSLLEAKSIHIDALLLIREEVSY